MPFRGVVCYIRDNGRVLLQLRAEGRFGGGWWNAPGGKLDDGESFEAAAIREVYEETGLVVRDLEDRGALTFYFGEEVDPEIDMRVFTTRAFEGEARGNEEGEVRWWDEAALPYDNMWADDAIWLPHVLAGKRVEGSFRLSSDHRTLLEHDLRVSP
jgi:8-oxo-dGTP diphosphatase